MLHCELIHQHHLEPTHWAERFFTPTSASFYSSPSSFFPHSSLHSPFPLICSSIFFPVALSPLPILLHWSSSRLPLLVLLALLCVDQNISLYPVICFTLIIMKKGEDEEDEVGEVWWLGGLEEDNRAQMKEKKMREKRGERKRRWGGGFRWEAAKKLAEGHSPAWNNFPEQIVKKRQA